MGFRAQRDVDRLSLPPGKDEHFAADDLCPGLYVRLQGEPNLGWFATRCPAGAP